MSNKKAFEPEIKRKVLIVGLGYVGAPLAIAASTHYEVFGYDTNNIQIQNLIKGNQIFVQYGYQHNQTPLGSKEIQITSNIEEFHGFFDVIVICVPTPIDERRVPDLRSVQEATVSISHLVGTETLVILESSSFPGTTRKTLMPLLESRKESSKRSSSKFYVAYSPERVDPGNLDWSIENTPKIVAGIDTESLDMCVSFYAKFVRNLVPASSVEVAEAAKLFENTYRLVNISLVNQFWELLSRVGIDTSEVLQVAYTKPFGISPFKPGPGIGGHCIPVDPYYLTWWLEQKNISMPIVKAAQSQNEKMHFFTSKLILKEIKSRNLELKVVLCGISYKPGIADTRETPADLIFQTLVENEVRVEWYDRLVNVWKSRPRKELAEVTDELVVVLHNDDVLINQVNESAKNYFLLFPRVGSNP